MGKSAVKIGVALGMLTTVASFFTVFELFMGDCFFEQGCGALEHVQLFGVGFASGLVGVAAAWIASRVLTMRGSRR